MSVHPSIRPSVHHPQFAKINQNGWKSMKWAFLDAYSHHFKRLSVHSPVHPSIHHSQFAKINQNGGKYKKKDFCLLWRRHGQMDDESMDRKTHGCMPPITHCPMRPSDAERTQEDGAKIEKSLSFSNLKWNNCFLIVHLLVYYIKIRYISHPCKSP